MNKYQTAKRLFQNKEKIVNGYKKTYPSLDVGGAVIQDVTNTIRVAIVDSDDNVISVLSVSDAEHYMRLE